MEVFNSRDERYRNPLGAVPSGTVVRISAFPERERFPIRGFLCVEYEQSGERKELPMAHFGTHGNREKFTVLLDTTGYVGLIWYHFRFENDGGYFYYGNNFSKSGGRAAFYGATAPLSYQLTVYDGSHQTIDWFGDGICYHIFPDRFARTEVPKASDYADRSRIIHEDWSDVPLFQPEPNGEITNRDFFGGSIAGVLQKLDYLESLGVTCLYFSPIFEAFSNHRYDTANYERIDPMFGTEEEFSELCRQAEAHGIRILLDGVFNHTGFDSLYFNGLGRYPTLGAYQSKESPYYSWYHFDQWPRQYQSWWGIHTLPAVNEGDPSYLAFITKSPDSIVRKWLRAGASGWRLDVADELPDSFICEIKKAALAEKPDALIIGEVWEDASNKISYGRRRQYILGGGLDGVMNYPFRTAVLNYLKGGSAEVLVDQIDHLMENYPPYAIRSAMNILGTHDTPRILSLLGMQGHPQHLGKEEQAKQVLSPQERKSAKELLYIASLIQMTMPGAPCIYYGDEVGMEGLEDPLNRRGYIWGQEDMDLLQWYRTLGRLRKKFRSLRQGKLHFRKAEDGLLIFERKYLQERIWVICNRSDQTIKTTLTKLNGPVTDLLTMRELAVSSEGRAFIPPKAAMLVEVESL